MFFFVVFFWVATLLTCAAAMNQREHWYSKHVLHHVLCSLYSLGAPFLSICTKPHCDGIFCPQRIEQLTIGTIEHACHAGDYKGNYFHDPAL